MLAGHATLEFYGSGSLEYLYVHLDRHYPYQFGDDAPLVPTTEILALRTNSSTEHFMRVRGLLYLQDGLAAAVKEHCPDRFLIRWRACAEGQADLRLDSMSIDLLSGDTSDYYAVVLVGIGCTHRSPFSCRTLPQE